MLCDCASPSLLHCLLGAVAYPAVEHVIGEDIKLVYVSGLSPNQLTFQFKEDIPKLDVLQDEISEFVSSVKAFNSPCIFQVDDPLLARFSEDQWRRAQVLGHSGLQDGVEVLFVDYGDSMVVPVADTMSLPQQFATLRKQAITYQLVTQSGVMFEHWPDGAFAKFEELVKKCQDLVATVMDCKGAGVAIALKSDACLDFAESIQ